MTSKLSPDQVGFMQYLLQANSPLDFNVAVAWIAAESGWDVTKANHNYLNVGPGRSYPSAQAAAVDALKVLAQPNMKAIMSHPGDPAAQIAAIKASPWDQGHYANGGLDGAYKVAKSEQPSDLIGATAVATPPLNEIPSAIGQGLSAIGNLFGLNDVFTEALTIALMGIFSIAGLAIIGLGLARLTGARPSQALDAAGKAQTAAGLVAAA